MRRVFLRREPNLDVRHRAFAFQAEAFEAIRELEYAGIFHEQGLGKTKIAIDLMLYWLERDLVDTVLIVAKKSLVQNWRNELGFHAFVKPKVLTQNRRANFYAFNSPARVMLAHYEVLKSEKQRVALFLKTRSVGVILDESAKIKNPSAGLTEAFLELAPLFKRRAIMTGTPVANRPYDLWSQIYFLDQGESLGSDFKRFKKKVDLTSDLGGDEAAQEDFEEHIGDLWGRISHFCVRETKSSGVISLPDKVISSISTDWEPRQWDLYREVRDTLRAVVVKEGVPTEDNAESILKRLLRLVQICSNPGLLDAEYQQEPGKLPYLLDLVARVCDGGEKCIVWTSFTDNADVLAREMRQFGSRRMHGKMAIAARNRAVSQFMENDETKVLVATPGAAREGLTLTAANHVIFYDRTFSLDDYLQAQDRIHRISQTRTCYVHNLLMEESIDQWVDVLLRSKQMAAQFAQGDVSREYYRGQMSYEFGEVLRAILGIEE